MPLEETAAGNAFRRGRLSNAFTNSLYACAPYRGCGHGCRYCDGRAERYYVEGDFAQDVQARINLPAALQTALLKERECSVEGRRCMLSIGSGVTDVYQAAEARQRLTQRCAGILAGFVEGDVSTVSQQRAVPPYPVVLLTKSALVKRDLALWSMVNQRAGFILFLSITPLSKDARARFEPGASPMELRWRTAEAFIQAGIPVGILAMPLLPGVSDNEAGLRSLYERANAIGVSMVMPGGLTLRPGRQKDCYLESLAAHNPALLEHYQHLYAENRPSGASVKAEQIRLYGMFAAVRKDFPLPFLLPHAVYGRMLPAYETLHILFMHMKELYSERGIATGPLVRASSRYAGWLQETRSYFRRHRSLPDYYIDEQFKQMLAGNALEQLLDNAKLSGFVRALAQEGAVFDYPTLRI